MTDLTQFPELFVRQEIEHLEVFTGFETANRYSVRTPSGEQLLYAFEESSMLGRTLLKKHRPLDIHVIDRNNTNVITASRSFYWFFAHLHVSDGSGQRIGSMQRRFSFLTRRFDLMDATGRIVAEMRGPIFRPFTFMVYQQGQEVGRVTKQWSGVGRRCSPTPIPSKWKWTPAAPTRTFRCSCWPVPSRLIWTSLRSSGKRRYRRALERSHSQEP